MLTHLQIQDFAIAPKLELEFEPGFTVITGETGAGKSILVDALGLLLGDRSDASWVRAGAERAELNAEFDVAGNLPARRWLTDAELGSDGCCLLRRSIAANGRSRAWINGMPVTVQQLGQLGDLLVELHGQNEHLRLTRPAEQLRLLDAGGAYQDEMREARERYQDWKALDDELGELQASSSLSAGEQDLLRYQVSELQEHALAAEPLEALEDEHRLLSRSGELLQVLGSSLEALEDDGQNLVDELYRVGTRLEPFQEFGRDIAEARQMLEEAGINAREAAAGLRRALDRIDLQPDRLQAVERQLGQLGDLARKHQVKLEDLPARRDELSARLERSENFTEQREALERRVNAALESYRAAAAGLSRQRLAHAANLSESVTGLMQDLGMKGGVLQLRVTHDPEARPAARGDDHVELRVSANPGFPPGPLAKIASGGELSRISLAIKVAAAGSEQRTQVFDEVDAGIGGETANTVGQLLRRLSANGQALCVTHLAQVAVCADRQVQVNKETGKDSVQVDSRLLDEQQRVEEIARMLSGRASEQSLAHARELLAASRR
jgi:DNA repair protein RecN (Recombination protein N)